MAFVLTGQQVAEINAMRRQIRDLAQRLTALTGEQHGEEFGVNWQHVQITDATADGDGNYAGKIVQPVSGSWEEIASGLTCKVRGGAPLQTGKTYIGRMSHYDGADAVFVVADGPTDNSSGEFQAFCRVDSLTSTTSGNGTPNVYPGWIIAWDTGSFFWGDQSECWITEINGGTPSLSNYLGSSIDYDSIDGKPILTVGG